MSTSLLTTHLLATAAMVGLIWFVQVVHYPLFAAVGRDRFADYEAAHQRRTSFVVGPLMALEGLTALALVVAPQDGVWPGWPLVGLLLLGVIHTSTVLLQVPAHRALTDGFDEEVARRLVRTNWIRTAGWTLRGLVAVVMMMSVAA